MKKERWYAILGVTLFAIAFGFVEASIVKYLRVIFYGGGFEFPLKGFVNPDILAVEWVREFFTLVMLLGVGIAAGKTAYEKFAYFLYSFAIWDIFYYVSLKALLNWPASLITWDILFLIPVPWIGPVLAPILYSLVMIALAITIIYYTDKGKKVTMNTKEWTLFILGSAIILYTFVIDYTKLIFNGGFTKDFFTLATNQAFLNTVSSFVPQSFLWGVFMVGLVCMIAAVVSVYRRTSVSS